MIDENRHRARWIRLAGAGVAVLAFLGLYAATNLTATGQAAENSLLGGWTYEQTLIYLPYHYLDLPPLKLETPTIVIGIALAAVIACARRRWRDLATVLIATPVAIYCTVIFKSLAGRPTLVDSRSFDPSYPSGHFAVAAAICLALLIAVPRGWLRWAAPVLLAWTAVIGGGVQALGWHRPSDEIGGALLVAAVFLAVTALLAPTGARIDAFRVRPLALAALLAAVSVAASWNPIPWTVPFAASAALIATAVTGVAALRLCRSTEAPSRPGGSASDSAAEHPLELVHDEVGARQERVVAGPQLDRP